MSEGKESTEKVQEELDLSKKGWALLALGRKQFLVGNFEESLSCVGEACGIFAELYGETAFECGDAYHLYGRVLLEVARLETDVLGDAIIREEEDDDDDDDDTEIGNKAEEKETDCVEFKNTNEENSDETETRGALEKKTVDEKKNETDVSVHQEKSEKIEMDIDCDTTQIVDSKDVSEDGKLLEAEEKLNDLKDDREFTTLKHAWEMLELAKLIFQRHSDDRKVSLKLADVFLQLGLVGMESETYDQAVSDILECIRIQKEYLAEDDRSIAEAYFNLGVAYVLNNNVLEALKSYTNSLNVLLLRRMSLQNKKGSEAIACDKPNIEDELRELESVIPEVQEKIQELNDIRAESVKFVKTIFKRDPSEIGESSKNNASDSEGGKVVSNITHLVRKKRKGSEGANENIKAESDATPAKVQKTDLW